MIRRIYLPIGMKPSHTYKQPDPMKLNWTIMAILMAGPLFLIPIQTKGITWSAHLEKIEHQALNLHLPFEGKLDNRTKHYLKSYFTTGRIQSERILGKTYLYFPVFEHFLKVYQLPESLKYLPVVESRLYSDVFSSSGAAGLWQFMPATARHFHLRSNERVDERLDLYKSTEAAVQFLASLHEEFDDWALVLAAYNCGPGRVRKAIRKSGSTNYYELKRFLPRQTREYIPRYIAATYLCNHFDQHELSPKCLDEQYEEIRVLKTYRYLSFNQISEIGGISRRKINFLNPGFKEGILPPSRRGNNLVLPSYAMEKVKYYLRNKQKEQDLQRRLHHQTLGASKVIQRYVVIPGDSLQKVAERYGYCDEDIQLWNDLQQHPLMVGQELLLYHPKHQKRYRP